MLVYRAWHIQLPRASKTIILASRFLANLFSKSIESFWMPWALVWEASSGQVSHCIDGLVQGCSISIANIL